MKHHVRTTIVIDATYDIPDDAIADLKWPKPTPRGFVMELAEGDLRLIQGRLERELLEDTDTVTTKIEYLGERDIP